MRRAVKPGRAKPQYSGVHNWRCFARPRTLALFLRPREQVCRRVPAPLRSRLESIYTPAYGADIARCKSRGRQQLSCGNTLCQSHTVCWRCVFHRLLEALVCLARVAWVRCVAIARGYGRGLELLGEDQRCPFGKILRYLSCKPASGQRWLFAVLLHTQGRPPAASSFLDGCSRAYKISSAVRSACNFRYGHRL